MLYKNRSLKHKVNDEFEYKQFVTVLTYCFVFRQGLSIRLRFCQTHNNIFKKDAMYHIFQHSFCAHVSRVLTLQSGQQCSTPNLKKKNYASIYSLNVNTVTFLSCTITVIFLGKRYIRQRQLVFFKYLINSFG